MGTMFMANLYASLDNTCKVEFNKFPPDARLGGPFHNFWSWTQKWKIYIDIFYGASLYIKCITAISNLHLQ